MRRHSSTLASKASLNPWIVQRTIDLSRGGDTSRLPHNCIGAKTQFCDLPVSSRSSIARTSNITDVVNFRKPIPSVMGELLGTFVMNFAECDTRGPLAASEEGTDRMKRTHSDPKNKPISKFAHFIHTIGKFFLIFNRPPNSPRTISEVALGDEAFSVVTSYR